MSNSLHIRSGSIYLISGSLSSSFSESITNSTSSFHEILPSITGSEFIGSIQLDPNDPGSFYISGSNTSASLYMSNSGKLGFGTTNPESEFDIRTDDFKIRKRGKASGIRMNEDGNLESFNNDTNSAATGSEVILKYTRGTSLSIPSGKRKEDLRDADFYKKTIAQANDTLGSIRWVADSGSLDQRSAGEAGNIKMQVASADRTGVTGKLSINLAADPGAASQQLYLINGATQVHAFTGAATFSSNVTVAGEVQMTTLDIGGTNVTSTAAELNILDGVTSTAAEINKLDGFTGDKDDLIYAKDLKATGVTATEFDYLDGVTSAIQTQLNAKTGISTAQANAITANTAKVSTGEDLIPGTELGKLLASVAESRGVYTLTFTFTTADGRTTKTANITMS